MGNTIWPYADVGLVGFGQLGHDDDKIQTLVENSISSWNEQRSWSAEWGPCYGGPKNGCKEDQRVWSRQKGGAHNIPINSSDPVEKADAIKWLYLISNPGRTQFRHKEEWLNSVRHFLNTHGTTYQRARKLPSGGWQPNPDDFDIFAWRTVRDPLNPGEGYWEDPGHVHDWTSLRNNLKNKYDGDNLPWNKDWEEVNFGYFYNWQNQNSPTDVNDPDGPPSGHWHGLGVTDFLEWLTGLNYVELFGYEYGVILLLTLGAIAYTDLYPFFYGH